MGQALYQVIFCIIISFSPHNNPSEVCCHHHQFISEEARAQRGELMCSDHTARVLEVLGNGQFGNHLGAPTLMRKVLSLTGTWFLAIWSFRSHP